MARKPQQPQANNAPVRWTDEEWLAIADRILTTRGAAEPASMEVAEIKAKDVFLAQDALPESRRRKLISIQQGFDASRKRLAALLEALPSREAGRDGEERESEATATSAPAEPPRAHDAGAADRDDAVPTDAAAAPGDATRPDAGPRPRRTAAHERTEPEKTAPDNAAARPALPYSDFIEMARPFVAMVCEEMARALVQALGENGSAAVLRAASGGGASAAPASGRPAERQRNSFQPEAGVRREAAQSKAAEPEAVDPEHEHDQAETDVQPLFDPKLPPDPNSPFRPKIALVAPRQDDLVDLQQRFPQFELIAVTLDELRSNSVLRTCQRIVGQREDVPIAADDYLRRTFGSRYFRANGGAARVREQLQSWLTNPSVRNAEPFRAPRQGNVKGPGTKKRQFRRPRP